jgi:hypothetical protein
MSIEVYAVNENISPLAASAAFRPELALLS